MKAILSVDLTSMQSFPGGDILDQWSTFTVHYSPILTTGHDCDAYKFQQPIKMTVFERTFLHSWAHRFGLHLFASTMAIRVILSAMAGSLYLLSCGRVEEHGTVNGLEEQHSQTNTSNLSFTLKPSPKAETPSKG
jgi:hypothetical protein